MQFSPLALEGAELVTLGEAEWLELRLEVDGLGCGGEGRGEGVQRLVQLPGNGSADNSDRVFIRFSHADPPPFF